MNWFEWRFCGFGIVFVGSVLLLIGSILFLMGLIFLYGLVLLSGLTIRILFCFGFFLML